MGLHSSRGSGDVIEWWQVLGRSVFDEYASTPVEFALITGLICATVLGTFFALNVATDQSLEMAASALFGSTSATGGQARNRSRDVNSDENESMASPTEAQWNLGGLNFVGLGCAVFSLAICFRQIFKKRTLQDAQAAPEDTVHDTFLSSRPDVVFQKRQELLHILSSDLGALFESRLEVRHLMSRKTKVVHVDTPREEVVRQMHVGKIRHLLVRRPDNEHLVGIISDRDVLQRSGQTAGDIMTPRPTVLRPDAQVNPVITQLIKHRVSCLPVVENGVVLGLVTTTDLMLTLQCTLTALTKMATEVRTASE